MCVKFSPGDLNPGLCLPHTPQAFILVEWPTHQGCAVVILPFNLHTPWMDLIYNINGSTLALKCPNNIATRTTLGFFVIQEKKILIFKIN